MPELVPIPGTFLDEHGFRAVVGLTDPRLYPMTVRFRTHDPETPVVIDAEIHAARPAALAKAEQLLVNLPVILAAAFTGFDQESNAILEARAAALGEPDPHRRLALLLAATA